jgi:hypothetical protein
MPDYPTLMKVSDVARGLAVSPRTVERYVEQGHLKLVYVGKPRGGGLKRRDGKRGGRGLKRITTRSYVELIQRGARAATKAGAGQIANGK